MIANKSSQKYRKPVFKKDQPDDTFKFQPLPTPPGPYPYHLDLEASHASLSQEKLIFHMLGDTGSLRHTDFLKLVASEMTEQFSRRPEEEKPQFLYHLGDVVYNHGESREYVRQFFQPFENYPAPVFAIAGNHDSDVNPDSSISYKSLEPFMAVFCDRTQREVAFSRKAKRLSTMQPNIYWTLITPVAHIIGLYCNVPKFGIITPEQEHWLEEELLLADRERPGKAIVLCLHHAPYSADVNHGSSLPMITVLNRVFAKTGVRPDIVFSGHVHNYQRFSKQYPDGKIVPFIVAGAGGYDELHPVAEVSDPRFTPDKPEFDHVKLENFCDNRHGFLRISIEKKEDGLTLTGEFYAIPHRKDASAEASIADRFVLHLGR